MPKLSAKSASVNKSKKIKQSSITMTLLPLAACGGGGGGGGGGGNTAPPAPTPPAEFVENPAGVFIARDDRDTTLNQSTATDDLTVTGKGGDDIIHTGSGADTIASGSGDDKIRAGEGIDTINAGSGNDAIVIVGTTTAGQYTNASITNSGGSGTDLSSLISLANLNGRATSEVEAGETIDGGIGINTLFIYGTVDLTGVTLNNVTVLVVNSDVTLTAEQIAAFTTVDGDGNSVINIEVPPGSPDNFILDLNLINVGDIAAINIDGNITIAISNENDIAGIGTISVGTGDQLNLDINDGASVNLGTLNSKFDQIDSIDISNGSTIVIDDPNDINELGLTEITGTGQIETDGSSGVNDALDSLDLDPGINTKPIATPDNASVGENETADIDVLTNDTDYDNDTLVVTAASGTNGQGTVSVTVTDDIRFNPGTDFDYLDDGESTQVIKTYTLSDGSAAVTGTITITVNGENDAPIAINDTGGAGENQIVQINVIANDTDVDVEPLTITNATLGPSQGSVSIVDNKIQFDPGNDFEDLKAGETEEVIVTYTVSDGDLTDDGTLTITVTGVNDAPIATDDTDSAGENEIITTDVLANDTDIENDALTITAVSVGANQGSVSIVGGEVQFNPGTDFDYLDDGGTAEVDVTYIVSDGNLSDNGTLTITVNGSNDAPTAVSDADSVIADQTISVDVIANDFDAEGDVISLTNATGPGGKGTVSIVDGKVFFDPGSDFDHLAPAEEENVEITYTITAAGQNTNGTLTVTVIGPNEPPVTVNDTASAGENETILVDVVANDTDADGHALTLTAVSVAEGEGTVSIVDGKVQFDPGADFDPLLDGESQEVEITYTVSDGIDETNGTLTVTVNGVTEEPIANSDVAEVLEGGTVYVDVMDNDTDPEGGEIELISATSDDGTVTIENGLVKFIPNNTFDSLGYGETGEATITYEIQSDYGIAEGTVTVTVNGKNDDPTAVNDTASVGEDSSIQINILGNDTDPNGDDLYIYSASTTSTLGNIFIINGQLVFDTAGDFNYLNAGQSTNVVINYDVIDGLGGTDTGQVTITINGSNDTYNPINTNFYLYDTNVYFPSTPAPGTFRDAYLNQDTIIFGWTFTDNITMGSGNDYVDGWDGGDTMDGGLGFDVLLYNESDAGVSVNLSTGTGSGGFAAGDSFSNFEGIEGSPLNDVLTGDQNGNSFYGHNGIDNINGAGGNDLIDGGAGADVLNGGDGVDTLSYTLSTSGVNVNLTTGAASGGHATGDTISNFEDVFGSFYNDVITGDNNSNLFDGYGGVDVLNGAGGDDLFLAYQIDSAHLNTFDGGTGYDALIFIGSSTITPYDINLANLNASNIEVIDLHQSTGFERLQFTAQDVIDITDANNTLRIFGGANDTFQTSSDWTYVSDFTFGDVLYSTFTSGDATIEVARAIPVDNMFLPVSGTFYEIGPNVWQQADLEVASLNQSGSTNNLIVYANEYAAKEVSITTGSGNDIVYINDRTGPDIVHTGDGNDLIFPDFYDTIYGGEGIDTVSFELAVGGAGQSVDLDNPASDKIYGIENIIGSNSDDNFKGDESNNIIEGRGGDDIIISSGGTDILDGGTGIDTIYFSVSPEAVIFNLATNSGTGEHVENTSFLNFENITGSDFADILTGDENSNEINGLAGNNEIYGLGGSDSLYGGNDNDKIYGGDDGDWIYGGFGNDELYGEAGNDVIYGTRNTNNVVNDADLIDGGDGDDQLYGEHGNDTILGGNGDDIIIGGLGDDAIDGGDGIDNIYFHYSSEGMVIDLQAGTAISATETNTILNIENVWATSHADNITGTDQDNIISAEEGDDTIYSFGGNDTIHDGNGQDTIYAGNGNDVIYITGDIFSDIIFGETGDDVFFIYDATDDIDGGMDFDTLRLDNYFDETLDLSDIISTNIEKIDFQGSHLNSIIFDIQDVFDITDADNILQFNGSNYDITSTGQGWVQGSDQNIDGEDYHTYTAGGATLLVDTDITQEIS